MLVIVSLAESLLHHNPACHCPPPSRSQCASIWLLLDLYSVASKTNLISLHSTFSPFSSILLSFPFLCIAWGVHIHLRCLLLLLLILLLTLLLFLVLLLLLLPSCLHSSSQGFLS